MGWMDGRMSGWMEWGKSCCGGRCVERQQSSKEADANVWRALCAFTASF